MAYFRYLLLEYYLLQSFEDLSNTLFMVYNIPRKRYEKDLILC